MKKGDLTLNIIIIAALGLLVLVILAVIFTGRLSWFSQSSASCEDKNGKCALECNNPDYGTEDYGIQNAGFKCADSEMKCCLKIAV